MFFNDNIHIYRSEIIRNRQNSRFGNFVVVPYHRFSYPVCWSDSRDTESKEWTFYSYHKGVSQGHSLFIKLYTFNESYSDHISFEIH